MTRILVNYLKDGGNGPLKTQHIGRRTAHGEIEVPLEGYSTGLMAWYKILSNNYFDFLILIRYRFYRSQRRVFFL